MTATLYIVRHGNTFDKGDTVTRVGGRTDLPLSVSGLKQAAALADHFEKHGLSFATASTSPLKRTRVTAETILASQSAAPDLKTRLFLRDLRSHIRQISLFRERFFRLLQVQRPFRLPGFLIFADFLKACVDAREFILVLHPFGLVFFEVSASLAQRFRLRVRFVHCFAVGAKLVAQCDAFCGQFRAHFLPVLCRQRLTAERAGCVCHLFQLPDALFQVFHAGVQLSVFLMEGVFPGFKRSQQAFGVSRVGDFLGQRGNHLPNILPLLVKRAGVGRCLTDTGFLLAEVFGVGEKPLLLHLKLLAVGF